MLKSLLEKLSAPAPQPLETEDARLAVAALLVRIARADHDYAETEITQINRILAERYALPVEDAVALRQDAEALEQDAPDTVRFTNAVKNAVPLEDRMSLIEAAWTITLSDGIRADEEDALMRMIPRFLGISDIDSNLARQRAARKLGQT